MSTDTETAAPESEPELTVVRRRKRRRRRRSSHDRPRRVDRLAQAERVVAIAAVAAAVLFQIVFLIHAGGLWRDEVNSVNTASAASLSDMWRLAEFESFPMPWLLALRGWMAFGESDMALRIFGLIGGLALPAAVWFALRRLTRSAPLASMALIAVNPEIVRWSGSVRAWGVGAALGIVAMVLVREASVALTRRRIVFALVASILAVQVQYQNALLLLGIIAAAAVVATARRRWAEALVPIGIGAVTSLSLLPYLGIFERRAAWNELGQVPIAFGDLIGRAWDVGAASGTIVVTSGLALLAMGLVAAVQWTVSPDSDSVNRSRRGVATYAVTAGILGCGALVVFYRQLSYPTQPWYFVGILSLSAVCAEVAVASAVTVRLARTTLVAIAIVVLAGGAPGAWMALRAPQTDLDAVATRLNADAARGDLIVVSPWFLATGLSRYYAGAASIVTIPPIEDFRVHRYDLVKAAMLTPDPNAPALARIQQTLESGHQVWVVGALNSPSTGITGARLPPPPLLETGWSALPYEQGWAREVGDQLRAHFIEGHEVTVDGSGGAFENVPLTLVRGWK